MNYQVNQTSKQANARDILQKHLIQGHVLKKKERELLELKEKILSLQNEVDEITRKRQDDKALVSNASKLVYEAENSQRERVFFQQIQPYFQDCIKYILENMDFYSTEDKDSILEALLEAGSIRDGVRMMFSDIEKLETVEENDFWKFDPILVIAMTHALYYSDQEFSQILEKLVTNTTFSCDYGVPKKEICLWNSEYPENQLTHTFFDDEEDYRKVFPLAFVEYRYHNDARHEELSSHKDFLKEFWKYDNQFKFQLQSKLFIHEQPI
jgi:hypothetical protein